MRDRIFSILTILTAGILAYLSATQAGFLSIDDVGMTEFVTRETLSFKSLLLGGASTYYRPLTVISYVANHSFWGLTPFSFHAVNIAIHLANSLMVYWLALALFADSKGKECGALIAALFFLLNPLNSEAVIWVSARPDLLCTFFFILAVVLLVERREQASASALCCFATACLASLGSKESSIALLGIVPLFLLFRTRTGHRKDSLLLVLTLILSTGLYALLRAGTSLNLDRGIASVAKGVMANGGVAQGQQAVQVAAAQSYSYPTILDAIGAYGFYLQKLVVPFPLNFTILSYDRAVGLAAFVVGVAVAWYLSRRYEKALLPLLIVFVGIVPPLLAYLGRIPWTPFGERYLYLPMVGFSLLVSLVLLDLERVPRWLLLGGVLLVALPTMSRVALWCDRAAFWEDALKNSPGFPKSYSALGAIALDEQRYDDAERHIKKAQSLGFNELVVWQNLSRIYLARKDYDGYEAVMLQAASHARHPVPVYHELILTLMAARTIDEATRFAKAIKYHLVALAKDPSYLDAYYNVGKLYYAQGDLVNADHYLRRYTDLVSGGEYRPFALRMIHNISNDRGSLRARKGVLPAGSQGLHL